MDPKWHHVGFLEKGGSVTASGERSGNIYESRDSVWGNICLSPAFVRPAVVCGAEARSEKNKVVARDGLRDQSLIQLLQLLFTAASSVYTVFTVWFCQIDCCGRFGT